MAEIEDATARKNMKWAVIVFGLVIAFLTVLYFIGYLNNNSLKRSTGDNTMTPTNNVR